MPPKNSPKRLRSRNKSQNQNTPSKQNNPVMSSSESGTSSPTSSPAAPKKSTKSKGSSPSLLKVSEAIANLEDSIKSLNMEEDSKLTEAFKHLTTAFKEISKHLHDEEKVKRESEDEKDDQKQRTLKGKFVITSPKNGENLVGDAGKYKDEDEVVKAVIDFAQKKYKVEIPEVEISTCYALKNGGIVLGLWHFGRDSAFQRIVNAIKSNKDVDKNLNVFFNYMLTKKRSTLLYNVRELKRKEGSKIKKFFTDETGSITVLTEDGEKQKITYTQESRRTISTDELISKFQ